MIDFELGDVLIQGSFHGLIWVGGEKPICHSTNNTTFAGVISQSAGGVFNKYSVDVFRCNDAIVAASAAEYARGWSVDTSNIKVPDNAFCIPKTPYSLRRQEAGLMATFNGHDHSWTVDTLFRVLKAMARHADGTGLSPNVGVSCSQFITYCYQAAALKKAFLGVVPQELVTAIKSEEKEREAPRSVAEIGKLGELKSKLTGEKERFWREKEHEVQRKIFKSLKGDRSSLVEALSGCLKQTESAIPEGVTGDAKFQDIDRLKEQIEKSDSFKRMGKSAADKEKEGVWGIDPAL